MRSGGAVDGRRSQAKHHTITAAATTHPHTADAVDDAVCTRSLVRSGAIGAPLLPLPLLLRQFALLHDLID